MALFIQFFPADAHPADLFGRVAYHQGMIGDILRDHGTGADEGVTTDGVATDDGAVGSQGGAFFDEGGADLVHFGDFRPGIVDVGEDHGWTAEDAVFEGHAFIDTDVVLDLALVADGNVGADDRDVRI